MVRSPHSADTGTRSHSSKLRNAVDVNGGEHRSAVTSVPSRPLPRWRVLFVDDDSRVRLVVAGMLRQLGQEVDVAPSGSSGLTMFRDNPYDLVITDLGMPAMNGHEVTRVVKMLRPDMPVIMLTGWGESPAVESGAQESKPDHILGKPLTMAVLYAVLDKLRGRPDTCGPRCGPGRREDL